MKFFYLLVISMSAVVFNQGVSANEKLVSEVAMPWAGYLQMLEDGLQFKEGVTTELSDEQLAQYYFMALASSYILMDRIDPDRPEFITYMNHVFNIAGPNPDTTYAYTAIDGDSRYRIFGNRGSVYMVDFQTGFDWLGFNDKPGLSFPSQTIDDFEINKDGSFEILLSKEKPEDYAGNWMALDERANYLFLRQVSYHPEELNARLAIEKVGGAPSNKKIDSFERRYKKMVAFTQNSTRLYLQFLKALGDDKVINKLRIKDFSKVGGVNNQVYHHGLYDVDVDQALVITFKNPQACRYWNIQTTDRLWQTHESMYSQSHLNGHINRADEDNVVRIVLSHQDPGVANWVDLNSIIKGWLTMRWLHCDKGSVPQPTMTLIDYEKVNNVLPINTKRVSKEQREQAIRAISASRQFRRNW